MARLPFQVQEHVVAVTVAAEAHNVDPIVEQRQRLVALLDRQLDDDLLLPVEGGLSKALQRRRALNLHRVLRTGGYAPR